MTISVDDAQHVSGLLQALFPEADHSFHVPARSGRKDAEISAEILDAVADWIDRVTTKVKGELHERQQWTGYKTSSDFLTNP